MTREELEKEAKVFATYYENLFSDEFETFYKAFLKVAEPREKRIAELENANTKISAECHKLVDSLEQKQNRIEELEAGRPKWHKVADGDYPKPNIAVLICLQFEKWTTTYIAYYRPSIKKWQIYNLHEAQRQPIVDDYIDSDEVIAWCEIPKYTDET